jgi:hypothetical protein
MTRRAALALIATPALAQSTIVMPLPGANGYAVIPPRQGYTTQVLPMPGGGWIIVPSGAQGPSCRCPAMARPPRHHSVRLSPAALGSVGQGRARLSCIAGLTTPARGV